MLANVDAFSFHTYSRGARVPLGRRYKRRYFENVGQLPDVHELDGRLTSREQHNDASRIP